MDQNARQNVVGRAARVEFCGCGDSIMLTIGAVTLRLDTLVAEDVAATIACALSLDRPVRPAASVTSDADELPPEGHPSPVDGETN